MDGTWKPDSGKGTVIAKGTEVIGKIESETDILLIGVVRGEIKAEKKIVVEGNVYGNLTGDLIIMKGRVEGDIIAANELNLTDKAVVIGNISSEKVTITEGVTLKGEMMIGASSGKEYK